MARPTGDGDGDFDLYPAALAAIDPQGTLVGIVGHQRVVGTKNPGTSVLRSHSLQSERRLLADNDDGEDTTVNETTKVTTDDHSPRVLASLRSAELATVTRRQQIFAGAALNVLANIVVLNLFVEFVDEVVIDSF